MNLSSQLKTPHGDIVDVANLLGHWVNVNERCDFIARLNLAVVKDQLTMSILSAAPDCDDNAMLTLQPIAGGAGDLAGGFCLFQNSEDLVIAANEKNGVLVLQCYRPATLDNPQTRQLIREFYYRQPLLPKVNDQTQFRKHNVEDNDHAGNNFTALLGNWRNTHGQTQWVDTLSIEQSANSLQFRASSTSQDHQWPAVELTPYYFDGEEFGFVARCCSEQLTSLFTAYSNKGLIVVSAFHRINKMGQESEVKHAFVREFYAKQLT
ncbi:MAG: hypothetical protein HRT35_05670 [Algicola sp.]|nr:hypothetical protein [Algicola sp.]